MMVGFLTLVVKNRSENPFFLTFVLFVSLVTVRSFSAGVRGVCARVLVRGEAAMGTPSCSENPQPTHVST